MTTLKREIKQVLKNIAYKVLEEQGFYVEALPGQPSAIDILVDAQVFGLYQMPFFLKASASERYKDLPTIGNNSTELAEKRLELSQRIEAQLDIMPDLKDKAWERVLNRIVRAEKEGETFENFVSWMKAGTDYNRPKRFQIARNPNLIFRNWKEAQEFSNQEQEEKPKEAWRDEEWRNVELG